MTEVYYERGALGNEAVRSLARSKVAALTVAGEGAMGTPGEVVIYFADEHCIVELKGNYVYGDLDLDTLSKQLRLSKRGPKGWTEFDLGMGNVLLVNADDYPMLDSTLRLNPDQVPFIFRDEAWIALSFVNDIMTELRAKIDEERTVSTQHKSKPLPPYDDEFWDDF